MFVLVHGSWHGGWCWRDVADGLRARGCAVYAPTCTGLGERAHLLREDLGVESTIRDICGVIEAEELDEVILVGHSLAGVTITGVADRLAPRLSRLVYLDAVIVQNGRSVLDSMPPEAAARRREMAARSADNTIPPMPADSFGIMRADRRAWVDRRATPQPFGVYADVLHLDHPVGNGVPCTYVTCTRPRYMTSSDARAWAASQNGWDMRDLDACHHAMVEQPEALATLLFDVSHASGGR